MASASASSPAISTSRPRSSTYRASWIGFLAARTKHTAPARRPAPLITRPFDYGAVITYPFVPQNWHATRYSDGMRYGVWYGALELETTVRETVYHWHRFLTDSFPLDREIVGERRVLTRPTSGETSIPTSATGLIASAASSSE